MPLPLAPTANSTSRIGEHAGQEPMPHSPVKSIKIDFHTADGVTPKPQPAPTQDPNANGGGMEKQDAPVPEQTQLHPLEEALFPHWMRANGMDPDGIEDHAYDYRGVYRQTNGQVHPPGFIQKAADTFNKLHETRHPAIQGMMDAFKPVPSHETNHHTLTSPSVPNYQGALMDKVNILKGGGSQDDQDAIRVLLNMIDQANSSNKGPYNGGGIQ